MNELDRQRIRALFPRASEDFLDANIGFGVRAKESESDSRKTLVDQTSGETEGDARIGVSIVMYRVRTLDRDNAYSSVKPLVDCLQSCGLISGDSEKEIDLKVSQVKVDHLVEQRTELHIQYPK